MLVAPVPSGAQVITVIGVFSAGPVPGREPQPVSSDASTAVPAAHRAVAEAVGEGRGEGRRRPVMVREPRGPPETHE
ncbi:hypothetical protein GCM10017688_10950 [Streptomyces ramulosus]